MTLVLGASALPLPYPFDRTYMQLALLAGTIVGAAAPLIGAFLVQKRLSLMGDGVGHLAIAGVAAGLLLDVWPIGAAMVVAVVGAIAVELLRSRGRASGDLAIALLLYSGVAAGVVLASAAGSLDANFFSYLFGSILTVSVADAWTVAVLGAGIVVVVLLTGRALFAIVVDEEAARVAGLPVDALNLMLAALTAVTVVAAMRVVGALLVAALMVLPVACGQVLGRSFRQAAGWSAVVGVLSVWVGLAVARVAELAPGATIVLVASAAFVLTSTVAGRLRHTGALDALGVGRVRGARQG